MVFDGGMKSSRMWIYFIFSALLVPVYLSPIERSHKSIEYLRQTIRDKDLTFGPTDLLCNCTSPGCDLALVNPYGEDFKGLCRSDGLCMAVVEKDGGMLIRNYLCVLKENMEPPGARLPFVCLNHKEQTHITKSYCCNSSLCNGQAEVELDPPTTPTPTTTDPSPSATTWWKVGVLVFVPLCIFLIAIILFLCYRYHLFLPHVAPANGKNPWHLTESGSTASKLPLIMNNIDDTKKIIGQLFDPDTTGSGQGGPLLIPRTIANQIELKETIGQGRFGEVIRGEWKGDEVAVKIFVSRDEKAYYREVDVYMTTMMRHPNILHFIGSDNKDTGEVTQLWLVTEYHPKGALLDYLTVNTVSESGLCRMIRSLAQGLAFLHCEIEGTHSKPAIAHRDLKSKNILVKKDGSLCIADLGLAVRYHNGTIDLPCNNKVGTVRYLSPEVLSETMPLTFDAFRMSDIYSMGLIMWEVARRTNVKNQCEPYELPYFDMVMSNPTQEEMRLVVVDRNCRPTLPPRFDDFQFSPVLVEVTRAMRECWAANPHARNQALVVRNMIDRLASDQHLIV